MRESLMMRGEVIHTFVYYLSDSIASNSTHISACHITMIFKVRIVHKCTAMEPGMTLAAAAIFRQYVKAQPFVVSI